MDNRTAPKYNFMKHTIVFGGSKFTRCIPLSGREAKLKIRPDFLCWTSLHYLFTSKSWRQIWWRVNQPFKYTFFITSEVNSTMTRCLFYHTDLGQNFFFFALLKPIILPGGGGGEGAETRSGTEKPCSHNLQSGLSAWWSADICRIFPTVSIFRLFRSKKRTGRGNQKCLKNWKKIISWSLFFLHIVFVFRYWNAGETKTQPC